MLSSRNWTFVSRGRASAKAVLGAAMPASQSAPTFPRALFVFFVTLRIGLLAAFLRAASVNHRYCAVFRLPVLVLLRFVTRPLPRTLPLHPLEWHWNMRTDTQHSELNDE